MFYPDWLHQLGSQYGLTVLVMALVGLAFLGGWFRWGPNVDRLLMEKDKHLGEIAHERDHYRRLLRVLEQRTKDLFG